MQKDSTFFLQNFEVCYAAVNTSAGFRSFFSEVFDAEKLERIVILKGGPGTGKSTLMKAFAARSRDRGYEAKCFLCSSDPKSLDAVLLPERGVAVLDGTAPHAMDPTCPGAVEEIFDAGAFWNTDKLREHKDVFFAMLHQKRDSYNRAYRLLKIAGEVALESQSLASEGIREEKLRAAARRQLALLVPEENTGLRKHGQIGAFNGSGLTQLDTFFDQAQIRVRITPAFGTGKLYLAALRALAEEKHILFFESVDVLEPESVHALYFPLSRVFFYVGEEQEDKFPEKTVNLLRFLSRDALREHRNRLRFLEKCTDSLLEKSADYFRQASDIHARLESYYVEAMDFASLVSAWETRENKLLGK